MKQKIFLMLVNSIVITAYSQSPVSGFMKEKGQASVVLSYAAEQYDKVYFVPSTNDAVPIFRDVKIASQSLYAEYGVTNKIGRAHV